MFHTDMRWHELIRELEIENRKLKAELESTPTWSMDDKLLGSDGDVVDKLTEELELARAENRELKRLIERGETA